MPLSSQSFHLLHRIQYMRTYSTTSFYKNITPAQGLMQMIHTIEKLDIHWLHHNGGHPDWGFPAGR